MFLTETVLKNFENNIISENVHLPHGIKSAKVVTHVDLDGAVSAISLINQLVKQGIPKNRITLEFAQYGDDEKQKKIDKKNANVFQPKNKSQFVGVVDYAKYPKTKPFEIFNKIMNFKGDKAKFVTFVNSRDWSKIANFGDFKKIFTKHFNYIEKKPDFLHKNNNSDKELDELYDALKAYSQWGKEDSGIITVSNVEDYSLALAKPDFGSDHHSNEQGALSSAKRGDLAAHSPSEAELFATKYAPGMWSEDDIKAVSMVDSAGYTEEELKNTIFLEKHFTGPDKKRNLATLISVIYDNLVKKDERTAKWIILNSNPSLVSLYNTTLQGLKFNGERLRLLQAIKDGDMKTGKEIADALPTILKKQWENPNGPNYKDRNGSEIKKGMSREEWVEKNKKDLENARSGRKSQKDEETLEQIKGKRDSVSKEIRDAIKAKKGKNFIYNNFTFFDGGDKRTQYSRYMTSLYSVNGSRSPYTLRFWKPSMFQVTVNTLYKRACDVDKVIDLSIINKHVVEDVCSFLRQSEITPFNIERIKKDMMEKNGGHSGGIWTFSGFDKIKPTSKELGGDEYWTDFTKVKKAAEIVNRKNGGGNSFEAMKQRIGKAKEIVPRAAERQEAKQPIIDKYNKIKEEAFARAMNSAVYWTNKLYPPRPEGLEGLKNTDERFEGK